MRTLRTSASSSELKLSTEELVWINNALNEVREFVPRTEFHARIGATIEEVERLLSDARRLLDSSQQKA